MQSKLDHVASRQSTARASARHNSPSRAGKGASTSHSNPVISHLLYALPMLILLQARACVCSTSTPWAVCSAMM